MALTPDKIRRCCATAQTYAKGLAYAREGRIQFTALPALGGENTVQSTATGRSGRAYRTSITLSEDNEQLTGYQCDCPAYAAYPGPCKHIVALALAYSQQVLPTATDAAALFMLRQYAQQSVLEAAPPTGDVHLVPLLEWNHSAPVLSLRVGRDRLYVVKSLLELWTAAKAGTPCHYGKQLSFVPSLGAFDGESAQLMEFLLTYYDPNYERYGPYYYGSGGQERYRKMNLPPFLLDTFLELYQGRTLEVSAKEGSGPYLVRRENPPLQLHIDRRKNGTYALTLPGSFFILEGACGLCIGMDGVLYRSDGAFRHAAQTLLDAVTRAKTLVVAQSDMTLLAATLLPALGTYLPVVSSADLEGLQPPARASRVYLDRPAPELITARVEHRYGERVHPGFQDKHLRQSLDLKGELQLENLLLTFFQEEDAPGNLVLRGDEAALYALAEHGLEELGALAEVLATEAFRSLRVRPPATVSVGVRLESDLLQLRFDVTGVDLAELEQVLRSYRKAKKYHRLQDGSFLRLEESSLGEFSELVQGLDVSAKALMAGTLSVPKYRALYVDTLLRQSQRLQYDRDGGFKRMIRDVRDVSDGDYAIPQRLRPVLRNYQKTGYRWLRTLAAYGFGGILADDMGLGKTLQVIALLLAQREEQQTHTVSIVVCPSSLVLNWQSEAHKFAPELVTVPVVGGAAQREALVREGSATADVLLTSYDALRRDVALYEGISFQYIIADEAQAMKNQSTQNAKAVKTLQGAARLALTGTPVENSLSEVWSIFDFLMPGYLYHYAKFRKQFEVPIVKQNDALAAASLRKLVSPFLLRRMKGDVLKELPEKIETVLYAQLEGEQKRLYLANALAARKELEGGLGESGGDKLQILALLTRLRQICCDPALVYADYQGESAKTALCLELLQRCIDSGHRVLLFSQFTSLLRRLAAALDAAQIAYLTITGETPAGQRLELVNRFNQGAMPVFLISLKAGGTGLSLTGGDVVIHFDPWWNRSAQSQASDRAHRIGQTKTVQVYKLIAKDTLEERILALQQSKADLAELIVQEGDGGLGRMTKSDLLALFQSSEP